MTSTPAHPMPPCPDWTGPRTLWHDAAESMMAQIGNATLTDAHQDVPTMLALLLLPPETRPRCAVVMLGDRRRSKAVAQRMNAWREHVLPGHPPTPPRLETDDFAAPVTDRVALARWMGAALLPATIRATPYAMCPAADTAWVTLFHAINHALDLLLFVSVPVSDITRGSLNIRLFHPTKESAVPQGANPPAAAAPLFALIAAVIPHREALKARSTKWGGTLLAVGANVLRAVARGRPGFETPPADFPFLSEALEELVPDEYPSDQRIVRPVLDEGRAGEDRRRLREDSESSGATAAARRM